MSLANPGRPEPTAAEWRAIEQALNAERRALRLGQQLGDDHVALLTEVRTDPVVGIAATALDANLASMQATFDQIDG
jgi:hypothetical protein